MGSGSPPGAAKPTEDALDFVVPSLATPRPDSSCQSATPNRGEGGAQAQLRHLHSPECFPPGYDKLGLTRLEQKGETRGSTQSHGHDRDIRRRRGPQDLLRPFDVSRAPSERRRALLCLPSCADSVLREGQILGLGPHVLRCPSQRVPPASTNNFDADFAALQELQSASDCSPEARRKVSLSRPLQEAFTPTPAQLSRKERQKIQLLMSLSPPRSCSLRSLPQSSS